MSNVHFLKAAQTRPTPSALMPSRMSQAVGAGLDRPVALDQMPLATLDALNLAAVVVDARLRVSWASRLARRDLGRAFGSLDPRSLLKPGRSEAADRLSQAVRPACTGQAGDVVLHTGSSDVPVLVRVLPFRAAPGDEPLALLLFVDLTSNDRSDATVIEGRLSALFGLTPMEAKVACRLANGDGMNRVAIGLGIAVSTARTHAARCYEKTGVRRQAALARLAGRLRLV